MSNGIGSFNDQVFVSFLFTIMYFENSAFILMRSSLWILFYLGDLLLMCAKEITAVVQGYWCIFFPESLIVLSFTFRSVIHFDVTFSSVFFCFVCGYPILVPLVRETIFLYELPCLLCQKSIAQNPIYLILDSLLCHVFYWLIFLLRLQFWFL